MYFSPNKRHASDEEHPTLRIHNIEPFDLVHETKFLGVMIDDKLSWVPHIRNLAKKLKCHIGSINRIKDNIPSNLHKQLYHTLFESYLIYIQGGRKVWTPLYSKNGKSYDHILLHTCISINCD